MTRTLFPPLIRECMKIKQSLGDFSPKYQPKETDLLKMWGEMDKTMGNDSGWRYITETQGAGAALDYAAWCRGYQGFSELWLRERKSIQNGE